MSYPIVCCCSSVPEAGWFMNHTDVILRFVNGTEFRCTQGMVRILQGVSGRVSPEKLHWRG